MLLLLISTIDQNLPWPKEVDADIVINGHEVEDVTVLYPRKLAVHILP